MAESAALLVDQILPELPIRQRRPRRHGGLRACGQEALPTCRRAWVLSFPFALRYQFSTRPDTLSQVLKIVYRVIAKRYAGAAGVAVSEGHTGSVTLIQRFGSVGQTPYRNGTTHVILEPMGFWRGLPRWCRARA